MGELIWINSSSVVEVSVGRRGIKQKQIKLNDNMKMIYTSPLAVEVNIEAEAMLAASLKLDNENKVDTSGGGQLSGDRRGEWGNLWS